MEDETFVCSIKAIYNLYAMLCYTDTTANNYIKAFNNMDNKYNPVAQL